MKNILIILLLFCIIITDVSVFAQVGGDKKIKRKPKPKPKIAAVSFKNNVMSVLTQYCLPCHSEAQMNPSDLYLENYDGLMGGGKHGKPVIAGKADSSIIIQKLSPKPPFGDPMPLKAKAPMSDSLLNIIGTWINQGAKNN